MSSKSCVGSGRILLVENEEVISEDFKIASIFNCYFNNITDSLNLTNWKSNLPDSNIGNDCPVLHFTKVYNSHPSIKMIKKQMHDRGMNSTSFNFEYVKEENVYKIIMQLDNGKQASGKIPTKILKWAAHKNSFRLADHINNSFDSGIFPDKLKFADITPILKKGDATAKENYRPISILPLVSKVFERVMFNQLSEFFEKIFSKFLCGFRKNRSTQHTLFNLIHKWQSCLDKSGIVGAILMDLSKAYDCLPHDLLIAKLNAYGVSLKSSRLFFSYLSSRKHRVKIGSIFSDWLEITLGVPQGSILGPLLFNIFLNDIFMFNEVTDIFNFADDNTLSTCDSSLEIVERRLSHDLQIILDWFKTNSLSANPSKFQAIILGTNKSVSFDINGIELNSSQTVKLLGIEIDSKLNFRSHVKSITAKASRKVSALFRIREYLTLKQAKVIFSSFILSNFTYCPLVWMFSGKMNDILINKTHHRGLKVVYLDFESSFIEFLDKSDKS